MLFLCLSVGLGIKIQHVSELCQVLALLGKIKIGNWDSHQDQELVLINDVEVPVINASINILIQQIVSNSIINIFIEFN